MTSKGLEMPPDQNELR